MSEQLRCIEVVTFKAKSGFSETEIKQALENTNGIIKDFDGFIKRVISINDEGLYIDIVYWESLAQAKQAASQLSKYPELMKNFEVIDLQTIQMNHFNSFSQQRRDSE